MLEETAARGLARLIQDHVRLHGKHHVTLGIIKGIDALSHRAYDILSSTSVKYEQITCHSRCRR